MATLYITEYEHPDQDDANAGVILPVEPAAVNQTVTFTTSTASSAFGATTTCVRIVSDTACFLEFATAPTATASDQYLPAGVVEYRYVPRGKSFKVAAYDGTS